MIDHFVLTMTILS